MLAWLVIVVNAIVLFYVCVFPGFSVADQAANPPNTKGMFTFDGNSFLTFTLPNYEIYSSSSENIQNLLTNQIKSPITSRESRLPSHMLLVFWIKPLTECCYCKVRICKKFISTLYETESDAISMRLVCKKYTWINDRTANDEINDDTSSCIWKFFSFHWNDGAWLEKISNNEM